MRSERLTEINRRPLRQPQVNGHLADLPSAIEAVRDHLTAAPDVLLTGNVVSLEASREVVRLAKSLGATVDLNRSQAAFDWLQALQAGGAFTTTINEARLRSDLIIILGDEKDFDAHPRVLHQLLDCPAPLNRRRLLLLGSFTATFVTSIKAIANAYDVSDVDTIELPTNQLGKLFKSATSTQVDSGESLITNAVRRLSVSIEDSENAVFVFSTTANYEGGIEVYRDLNEYILTLSSEKKVSALPLSSATLMFSQCCTWLTGFPGRFQYVDQVAQYNPWLFTTDKWSTRASNDSLVLSVDECASGATIAIKTARRSEKLVEIPIAVSGAQCASTLYKADGSTMICVGDGETHTSAAEILRSICSAD